MYWSSCSSGRRPRGRSCCTSCTASAGRPRAVSAVLQDGVQGGVGVERFLAAAQDDRVAALDAQPGGVDGDVGPRFVDEEDDAERHADLVDLQAVGPTSAVEHAADRVGQGGDLAQPLGGGANPLRRRAQAVDRWRRTGPLVSRQSRRWRWRRGFRPSVFRARRPRAGASGSCASPSSRSEDVREAARARRARSSAYRRPGHRGCVFNASLAGDLARRVGNAAWVIASARLQAAVDCTRLTSEAMSVRRSPPTRARSRASGATSWTRRICTASLRQAKRSGRQRARRAAPPAAGRAACRGSPCATRPGRPAGRAVELRRAGPAASRLCSRVLPKPMPGSMAIALGGDARCGQ